MINALLYAVSHSTCDLKSSIKGVSGSRLDVGLLLRNAGWANLYRSSRTPTPPPDRNGKQARELRGSASADEGAKRNEAAKILKGIR